MSVAAQSPKIVYRGRAGFLVYQATTARHRRSGHKHGQWYYRAFLAEDGPPSSPPFPSRDAAEQVAQLGGGS